MSTRKSSIVTRLVPQQPFSVIMLGASTERLGFKTICSAASELGYCLTATNCISFLHSV